MRKLAVLMTCHNRRENTLKCLKALFLNAIPEDIHIKVFLVTMVVTMGLALASVRPRVAASVMKAGVATP